MAGAADVEQGQVAGLDFLLRSLVSRTGGCPPPVELVILVIAGAGFLSGIIALASGAITV